MASHLKRAVKLTSGTETLVINDEQTAHVKTSYDEQTAHVKTSYDEQTAHVKTSQYTNCWYKMSYLKSIKIFQIISNLSA
jgi:uncharacterized protein YgiM (DUF1202 family)